MAKFEVLTGGDAETARKAGEKLQYYDGWKWYDRSVETQCGETPIYRIAPKPPAKKRVPLSPEDITPGTAIRHPDWIFVWRWTMVSPRTSGVCSIGCQLDSPGWTWEQLMDRYEYSTDLGKTWNPCWKEAME